VRGENIASGYWKDSATAPVLDADGWFHTGDLGERDANGNLYFKGRQKNVIVTPAGLNIYPEDLEAELRKEPAVRDCVVIGLERDGNAEPCAVLLLRDVTSRLEAASPAGAVRRGNERLPELVHGEHAIRQGTAFYPEERSAAVLKPAADSGASAPKVDEAANIVASALSRPSELRQEYESIRKGTASAVPKTAANSGALAPEANKAANIVASANSRLADFQQMRSWIVWPGQDFPRTPTQKPILARIREGAAAELAGRESSDAATDTASPSSIAGILQRISRGGANSGSDLQLSSIERVELISALEDRYQVDLSEADFSSAQSVADLEKLVQKAQQGKPIDESGGRTPEFHYPRWPRWWPMRWIRALAFYCLVRPAMLLLGWPRVRGSETLRGLKGPVLIVANHVSYIDPGFVLTALPARLRWRTAVAMGGETLNELRHPPPGTKFFRAILGRIQYPLVIALFHVFPLPVRAGFRKSFEFAGELVDCGWSVLVFPEGVLTPDGAIGPFRAGIGLLVSRLRIPVIPMRLEGLFDLREANKHWTSPGHIRVTVGAPVTFPETESPENITRELERRVKSLA
jgi:1-acyl-sn-glycerol-3-phosphate acyltransferase